MSDKVVVFVHGWSVTHTKTYGELPRRLHRDARKRDDISLDLREIFLGRYISFYDEVRVSDIAQAFETAVQTELGDLIERDRRFVCITHSTGGPVIREWWSMFYHNARGSGICPMSHLIMLAPANYGSALAALGKERVGRLKAWWNGVEPGKGVLEWLELGNARAWELNREWIAAKNVLGKNGILPFVITGQTIDRKLYDHLNPYTGETGSDGVIRVAAANLSGIYIRLQQYAPVDTYPVLSSRTKEDKRDPMELYQDEYIVGEPTALRVVSKKSHSGRDLGIMRSIPLKLVDEDKRTMPAQRRAVLKNISDRELIESIFRCIHVSDKKEYSTLTETFADETVEVQRKEQLEIADRKILPDRHFIHDRYSMIIFRVTDDAGFPVNDFDLVLTGEKNDPNRLPEGFFVDCQRNSLSPNTITYYLNYDVMMGANKVKHPESGRVLRRANPGGVGILGLRVTARPNEGFALYAPAYIEGSKDLLTKVLVPNTTTMVDIVLHRIVRQSTFTVSKFRDNRANSDFKDTKPSDEIAD